ncbi:MAG TPA: hypothetical protein VGX03_27825 [Candidatus Binatia bacterium]|jgi:hypothetical protein|nr:hypothetical protein [Candidatus Binatia bacterium]
MWRSNLFILSTALFLLLLGVKRPALAGSCPPTTCTVHVTATVGDHTVDLPVSQDDQGNLHVDSSPLRAVPSDALPNSTAPTTSSARLTIEIQIVIVVSNNANIPQVYSFPFNFDFSGFDFESLGGFFLTTASTSYILVDTHGNGVRVAPMDRQSKVVNWQSFFPSRDLKVDTGKDCSAGNGTPAAQFSCGPFSAASLFKARNLSNSVLASTVTFALSPQDEAGIDTHLILILP